MQNLATMCFTAGGLLLAGALVLNWWLRAELRRLRREVAGLRVQVGNMVQAQLKKNTSWRDDNRLTQFDWRTPNQR